MVRVSTQALAGTMIVVAVATWLSARALQTSPAVQGQAARPAAPSSVADLKPVEQDDRILKSPPAVDIGPDGTATVSFDTMVPTPACRVYLGTLNADTTLDTTFFPASTRESLTQPATSHTVAVDLRRLAGWLPAADEGAVREADAYVRIEGYDSRSGGARFFERRVHYAVMNGRYQPRTTILYGPALDLVTPSSATVSWDTDRPGVGRVEVWTADGAQKVAEIQSTATAATRHLVTIDGLRPRHSYKYRVLVQDQPAGPVTNTGRFYAFRTAPSPGGAFSFVFLSDGRPSLGGGFINFNGVNAEVTTRLIADAYRRGAEFALFGGDLSAGTTSSTEHLGMMLDTWRHLNDPVAHVMPIYEGIGNHEWLYDAYTDAQGNRYRTDKRGDSSTESEFGRRFVNPANAPAPESRDGVTGPPYTGNVYSFDYGNTHLVMLNTDYWLTSGGTSGDTSLGLKLLGGNRNGYLMANQLAWLDRDLAAARNRGVRHIFIAAHEAAFPVGGHLADAMWWNGLNDPSVPMGDVVDMRSRFLTIVNRHRVTALLFGHEHSYARLVVSAEVDKALTRPITQFVSGGAGAPFYAQDKKAPWNKAVRKFAAINHYVLFTVTGGDVRFEAIDLDGRVFDQGVIH